MTTKLDWEDVRDALVAAVNTVPPLRAALVQKEVEEIEAFGPVYNEFWKRSADEIRGALAQHEANHAAWRADFVAEGGPWAEVNRALRYFEGARRDGAKAECEVRDNALGALEQRVTAVKQRTDVTPRQREWLDALLSKTNDALRSRPTKQRCTVLVRLEEAQARMSAMIAAANVAIEFLRAAV